jgi:hypothetical protein
MGNHDSQCATEFVQDLAARLKYRVQITTDGHRAYLNAVDSAFGMDVDYAQLVKIYGKPLGKDAETRYECIGIETKILVGDPDVDHIARATLNARISQSECRSGDSRD